MQLVQSNDRANRLSFKGALAHKVDAALAAKPKEEAPDSTKVVLDLPSNYQELNEQQLHFSLMHNRELRHSRQSATLAVEIVSGKMQQPTNVSFNIVELPNPVQIPEFEKTKTVKRSPARPLTAADTLAAKRAEEDLLKRSEYKHYLANLFQRTQGDSSYRPAKEMVLRVPQNWNELSEQALFHALTHQTELEHSRQSAYLAMDILSGKVVQPENVTLQEVVLFRPVAQPAHIVKQKDIIPDHVIESERPKREGFKQALAAKTAKTPEAPSTVNDEQVLLLPAHYEELSEAGLFYTLTHNPELKHSHESALLALAVVFGKTSNPPNVSFSFVDLAEPRKEVKGVRVLPERDPLATFIPSREVPKRQLAKQELADRAAKALAAKPVYKEEPTRTVLLPVGYQDMNPGELHFALIRNPEFKHTNQQAIVTADMLSGRIGTPSNVVFKTIEVENIQLATESALPFKPLKAKEKYTAKPGPTLLARAQLPITETPANDARVLLLPHNYEGMTETQLHFALSHNREYGHSYETTYETIDIVYGRKACPEGTVFSMVKVENPVERAY